MAGIEVGVNQTAEQIRDYFRRRPQQGNRNDIDGSSGSLGPRDAVPRPRRQPSKCESLGILTGKPKHRQYSTLDARIKSYENENWKKDESPDIKVLAEAGLAYTGVGDSVRCYYCSIGLKDWPENACPWEQHILASADCGHVAQCKGKAYVRRILGEHDDGSDVEVDDSHEYIDTVEEALKRNEASVTAVRLYCSNKHILNKAVKSLIRNEKHKFSSTELMSAIGEIRKESKTRNVSEQLTDTTCSDCEDLENDGNTSESDEEDEEENRKLKDPIICKICFNTIACIITLPCGHMVSCPQCISALTKCAVCRTDIKGTVRALMAV